MRYSEAGEKGGTWRFIDLYFTLMGFAIAVTIFLSSYFMVPATAMLSFPVEDGHCIAKAQGLGFHCFGDYYFSLTFANKDAYVDGVQQYPPFAIVIFWLFNLISKLAPGTPLGLVVYFILGITFWLVVIFRTFKPKLAIRLSALVISSTPFIILLDRGNVLIFVIPMIFMFLKEFSRNSRTSSMCWLLLAALIKPHLLLFSLMYIRERKFIDFSKLIAFFVSVNFALFFFFSGNILTNIKLWLNGLSGYQGLSSEALHYPVNLSASNTFGSVWKILQTIKNGDIVNISMSQNFTTLVSLVLFCVFLLGFSMAGKSFGYLDYAVFISIALLILPGTTYSYYLALVYPLIFLHLSEVPDSLSERYDKSHAPSLTKLYKYSALIILIPLAIPLKALIGVESQIQGSEVSITFLLIGLVLLLLFGSLVSISVYTRFRGMKKKFIRLKNDTYI